MPADKAINNKKNAYKMVVLSNPVKGREDECDDWYQNTHLADVVALPGFTSAQRYRVANTMVVPNPYQYLAVYEIETDDLDHSIRALVTGAESGGLVVSEALDSGNAYAVVYEASGKVVAKLT